MNEHPEEESTNEVELAEVVSDKELHARAVAAAQAQQEAIEAEHRASIADSWLPMCHRT